jgi:hypothetical protein
MSFSVASSLQTTPRSRTQVLDRRFAASICAPAEQVDWTALDDPHAHFSSLRSSKEALAKAWPGQLRPAAAWCTNVLARRPAGCWQATSLLPADRHVARLCWRLEPDRLERQEDSDPRLTTISTEGLRIGA